MSALSGRILVTGGAGFIGSHLVRHFAGQAPVTVLDDLRSGYARNLDGITCRFVRGSILDDASLREAMAGAEEVYHLAAMISVPESVAKPAECAELNTEGTRRVLAAASEMATVSSPESMATVPASAASVPATILRSVDFPHPLGPTNEMK